MPRLLQALAVLGTSKPARLNLDAEQRNSSIYCICSLS